MEEPFGAGSVSGVEVSGDDRLHYQQSWSPPGALLLHDGTVCWKGQEQTNQPGIRKPLKLPPDRGRAQKLLTLLFHAALFLLDQCGSPFPTPDENKKGNCEFISHNSEKRSLNLERKKSELRVYIA